MTFAPQLLADLQARNRALVDDAAAKNGGRRAWRERKLADVQEIVDHIADKTPRFELLDVNLRGDLNLVYRIHMPVPRWPIGDQLVIGDHADFHLHYQEDWCEQPPAPWEPLGILDPMDPFHPNMRPALRGAICLGKLYAGISCKEVVLRGYYAVSLQDKNLDETDPEGILNLPACEYFRNHPQYCPLTPSGLLEPWEGVK